MKIKSINPYTEEVNWTYDSFSIGECRTRIEKSRDSFSIWSSLPSEERVKSFTKVAEILRQNSKIYSQTITKEMGKPIRQSRHEVEKCARLCDSYAENVAGLLKDEVVDTGTQKSYVTFEPLGVIFGPVAPVITAMGEDEAVKIANSTEYGLGAKIWYRDLDGAESLAKRIKSGSISINGMIKSDPRLPFGGIKKSGVGRELSH